MAPQRRKQSLATALRRVRTVMRKAAETDFTTNSEDVALATVYAAVTAMASFLEQLSRDESICDCAERSWRGEGHDTQCNVQRIALLLEDVGTIFRAEYYVVFVDGDVEPYLHGPFKTEEERDKAARKLRAEDRQDPKSGIYRLDLTPAPKIDAYSGAFFEDEEDGDANNHGNARIGS